MNLNCLIVDDEPIAQNILKGFIKETPGLHLTGICDNAMEAVPVLKGNSIDLMFLDIEMPKISGISFLKTLDHPPAVIFTTAYREFALEGYDLNVVDYLLKPFSFERFIKAVNKVDISVTTAVAEEGYCYFKVDRKNIKVYFKNIIYIEGLSNYVIIHLPDKQLIVYHKLLDLEKLLPNKKFIRIHKSYIISLDQISAYGTDYVELGEKQLTIGKTYRIEFFNRISFDHGNK